MHSYWTAIPPAISQQSCFARALRKEGRQTPECSERIYSRWVSNIYRISCHAFLIKSELANDLFQQIKARSKEILEESRRVLSEATDEVREEYNKIEEVRLQYEKEEKEALEKGLPEPDKSAVDFRTVEELREALETQKARLELIMGTNPAVVKEYEARKKHVGNSLFDPMAITDIRTLVLLDRDS